MIATLPTSFQPVQTPSLIAVHPPLNSSAACHADLLHYCYIRPAPIQPNRLQPPQLKRLTCFMLTLFKLHYCFCTQRKLSLFHPLSLHYASFICFHHESLLVCRTIINTTKFAP